MVKKSKISKSLSVSCRVNPLLTTCRAVAARTSAAANIAAASITASASNAVAKPKPSVAPKKDIKKTLKGVVVKKKMKPVPVPAEAGKSSAKGKGNDDDPPGDDQPNAKRRKITT